MKIEILTQPLNTNYVGILQNYALQTVLNRMGHEVWTLDIGNYTWCNWLNHSWRIAAHKLLGHHHSFAKCPYNKNKYEGLCVNFRTIIYHLPSHALDGSKEMLFNK